MSGSLYSTTASHHSNVEAWTVLNCDHSVTCYMFQTQNTFTSAILDSSHLLFTSCTLVTQPESMCHVRLDPVWRSCIDCLMFMHILTRAVSHSKKVDFQTFLEF